MEYHIREWVDESYRIMKVLTLKIDKKKKLGSSLAFWLAKYCFFFKIKTFSACLVFRKY